MIDQSAQPDMECIYQKNSEIVTRKVLDETFLVRICGKQEDMQKLYVLDTVGEFIWDHLNGSNSLDRIRLLVEKEFTVPATQAQEDLVEFVDELNKADLVWKKET